MRPSKLRVRLHILSCFTASLTVVALLAAVTPARAQPSGYKLQAAFPGVSFITPIGFATPPGETNRLFVIEKGGRIKVLPNLSSPKGTTARPYSVYRKPVTAGSTVALPRIGSAIAPCYLIIVQ